ncbi:MAG: hypothetical protein ACTSR8_14495 [Promethearchaeota archaeon]
MSHDHEDEDKSIVDALGALGWIEDKEEDESNLDGSATLKEQLKLFKQQNAKLNKQIADLNLNVDGLKKRNENLIKEKNELLITIEDYKVQLEKSSVELAEPIDSEEINALKEQLADKDEEIRKLKGMLETDENEIEDLNKKATAQKKYLNEMYAQVAQKNETIENQIKEIEYFRSHGEALEEKLKELTSKLENEDFIGKIKEKDQKIEELIQQIKYLEEDTVQKSKYEKIEMLLEKKDEVITEKEKALFELQNAINAANLKINDLQQQIETFSLVKKDLEKKENRIKELVLEIENLKQKIAANADFVQQLEKKYEEAQKKAIKSELLASNTDAIIQQKEAEAEQLKSQIEVLQKKLYEAEQIEDKILSDMQKIKDQNLRLETQFERAANDIEVKNREIIELKKRIKLMRRDLDLLKKS